MSEAGPYLNSVNYVEQYGDGEELNDTEQTVCLYYDGVSTLYTYVETEDDSWAEWEPSVDAEYGYGYFEANYLWAYGVGSEAQLWLGNRYDFDNTVYDHIDADTYGTCSSDFGLDTNAQQCIDTPDDTGGDPVAVWTASWSGVDVVSGNTFNLYGLFTSCGQIPGSYDTEGCNWGADSWIAGPNEYGIAATLTIP